jgi:hypothetical protein
MMPHKHQSCGKLRRLILQQAALAPRLYVLLSFFLVVDQVHPFVVVTTRPSYRTTLPTTCSTPCRVVDLNRRTRQMQEHRSPHRRVTTRTTTTTTTTTASRAGTTQLVDGAAAVSKTTTTSTLIASTATTISSSSSSAIVTRKIGFLGHFGLCLLSVLLVKFVYAIIAAALLRQETTETDNEQDQKQPQDLPPNGGGILKNRCPWPFIVTHDPIQFLKDSPTWMLVTWIVLWRIIKVVGK